MSTLGAPTKIEQQWMNAVRELGCAVCARLGHGYRQAEVHHILNGSRRISHLHTIPLCAPGHHRYGSLNTNPPMISRHPWKRRFEEAYGSETDILSWTRERLLLRGHNFLL